VWHAHLARDFTGGTPLPLFKLTHRPDLTSLDSPASPSV